MSDVPADQGRPGWPASSRPSNGMGTAALVLGIVGFLTAILVVGGLIGVLAIIFGFVGLSKVRRGEATNRGSAIAGIVLGAVSVILAGILVAVGATWIAENADEIEDLGECLDDANTERQRDDCANRFEDQVDPNG